MIPNAKDFWLVMVLNVNMLMALTLQLRGVQLINILLAMVLNLSQVVLGYIGDWVGFAIKPNALGIIGTVNVIIGILLINYERYLYIN